MKPAISIVTPCYNHGKYIIETVQSVKDYNWKVPVEHIIVNDGSTDEETIAILKELKQQGIVVIDQKNGGPSAARNTAIKAATGDYILPLDADNKIYPAVFEKAYDIMERDKAIAVVYTDAQFIGDKKGKLKSGKLDVLSILNKNHIDTCSLLRKEDMTQLGGYDANMPFRGNEDWELWLNMISNNKKFYYLEEVGFQYRYLKGSLSHTASGHRAVNRKYLFDKYEPLYKAHALEAIGKAYYYGKRKKAIRNSKVKSIIKILLNKPLI